ncbi:hypothetical protein M1D96_11180 [Pseudomonas sp. D1-3]
MIDALDKQTQALPFEPVKRGRGRPKTGNAMTPAEKQRAYRERQKAVAGNVTENTSTHTTGSIELLRERALSRGRTCVAQARMIGELEKRIAELEAQLASRSTVTESEPEKCWRIQKRKTSKGRWSTMKGSYKSESEAHEALLEMPQEHPVGTAWYRVLELKDPAAGEL